ncbi:MAG: UDP-3-O-(3-hydroxymyristoyl)-like [Holophagaceae bacterium]|nr:UDP-3-O-(3-hydroxymyristoyl)-like [Holophagaceae bacterium]
MLWRDNAPISGLEVDVFGGGRVFRTLQPFLESEGIRIGSIYDDVGTFGSAWDPAAYAARLSPPPMLYCVGYQPEALQRMAIRGGRYRKLVQDGVRFATYVSPQAQISPECRIGNGSIIMPNAFLHCRVQLGECVYVNVGALISHDGRIADNVFLGPRATLAGEVSVESDVFIGVNATIIDMMTIGFGALVAGGAVVTSPVGAQVLVAGVPARVKKHLGPESDAPEAP